MTVRLTVAGLLVCLGISCAPACAQPTADAVSPDSAQPAAGQSVPGAQEPAGPPATPRHTGLKALAKNVVTDFTQLPSKENTVWAMVGGGLAVSVHPADED